MGDASYLAPVTDDPFEKVARRHCLDRQASRQYAAVQQVTPIEGQEVAGAQKYNGRVRQLQITRSEKLAYA